MTRKTPARQRHLDPFQRFIAQCYADGEFAYIETPSEAETTGDGLFAFLISELSVSEGCTSKEEARRRLDKISDQLNDLAIAISKYSLPA